MRYVCTWEAKSRCGLAKESEKTSGKKKNFKADLKLKNFGLVHGGGWNERRR